MSQQNIDNPLDNFKESLEISPIQLRDALNRKYGAKKNKLPFTHQDIYQYRCRGNIPNRYGGFKIKTTNPLGNIVLILNK